jgi:hypothetical protein
VNGNSRSIEGPLSSIRRQSCEGELKRIQCRLWDLLPMIRNHVYHPRFAGSYSLKSVLPALVPGITYAGMEVANGRTPGWLGSR